MTRHYGATPAEWQHFDLVLGLTGDLLPVVSNPTATISPLSKMQGIGKTPSIYNALHKVAGIPNWTQRHTTQQDIDNWSKEHDYGICIQTRTLRAIDIDIIGSEAGEVQEFIENFLDIFLPCRSRPNSSKRLLVFSLVADLSKRVLRTQSGIIELLGTGQQFIAVGTHPTGARYEWEGGLPTSIPELTLEGVDGLWQALGDKFATEASVNTKASTKQATLADAHQSDPIAKYLADKSLVLSQERDGRLHIDCPFKAEHTGASTLSATSYFPAHTGGYENGHFKCLHAHCAHRTDDEFKAALGAPSIEDMFDLTLTEKQNAIDAAKPMRFESVPAHIFASGEPPEWIVEDILPQAALAVIYGDSGSGKTFWLLDLVACIARGVQWRTKHVKQGKVTYICAEGAGGFRGRLRAYAHHHSVGLASMPLHVIGDAPNFMLPLDVRDVLASIRAAGGADIIVVDTFAQVMPGANENASEDMGKALAHCRALHKHTGALVILVHHSGKDASRGARGWSGLRATADVQIEIVRNDDDRVAIIDKQKDGTDGESFGFKLIPAMYGLDRKGNGIGSCVIEHSDNHKGATRQRLGKVEKIVLTALLDCAGISGDKVRAEELIQASINQLVAPIDPQARDLRRQHVSRGIEKMVESGELLVEKGFIRRAEAT